MQVGMALTPNSLARRKPGVQIPSPPPPTSQVRASSASSWRRSPLVAAAPRPQAQVAVQLGRLAATRRLGPGPSTVTTERGRRLQPELRIRCDARQSGPEVTLAHADGQGTRRDGQTRPSWPCGCRPTDALHEVTGADTADADAERADTDPRDTGRPHRTVDSGSWTSHARTLDVHPDTGHRTRGRDRVLGQGDLDTAGTGQTSRTTTTTRPPAGTPNRGPVDGTCCAR